MKNFRYIYFSFICHTVKSNIIRTLFLFLILPEFQRESYPRALWPSTPHWGAGTFALSTSFYWVWSTGIHMLIWVIVLIRTTNKVTIHRRRHSSGWWWNEAIAHGVKIARNKKLRTMEGVWRLASRNKS